MRGKSARKDRPNPRSDSIPVAAPTRRPNPADERRQRQKDLLEKLKEVREWIALIFSIIGLLLSLLGWGRLKQTNGELQDQKGLLERLENCEETAIEIEIDSPEDGSQIRASHIDIGGTSTLHERCRYVFLVVRGVSGKTWKVADLVQVNRDGRWTARVDLDRTGVRAGEQFDVDARVTAQGSVYQIGQVLPAPPQRGVPSNIIRLRRLQ
jgi:hypothetical protein